ncbi:MAG: hypothetical protein QM768_04630 [Agriterribacter sp.]
MRKAYAAANYFDKMINKYHITLKQQFFVASAGLIKYSGLAIIYFYFYGLQLQHLYIYIFLFFFIFDILPAIILHLQYLYANSDAILTIDKLTQTIVYRKKGFVIEKQFSDIISSELISSFGGGKYNAGWYAFGEYRYCKLVFKDNTIVIITCLMVNDIQNTLESLLRLNFQKSLKVLAFII